MNEREIREVQRALCDRVGSPLAVVGDAAKLGVSRSAMDASAWPLTGIRHPPEGGTCGWYVFAGEYSDAEDFYEPMHAEHLFEARPEVVPYLGMAPGWGFVIAPGYEDVWQDDGLLDPER